MFHIQTLAGNKRRQPNTTVVPGESVSFANFVELCQSIFDVTCIE